MLDFLIRFCAPYFKLAYISAWGVAQNIEGLGYFGALNNYYEEGRLQALSAMRGGRPVIELKRMS